MAQAPVYNIASYEVHPLAEMRGHTPIGATQAEWRMTWKRTVLVVANVTATSSELVGALKERAAGGPATFTLIIPATAGRAAADARLAEVLEHLREHGLEVDGSVGDADPVVAVAEAWDPRRHDVGRRRSLGRLLG